MRLETTLLDSKHLSQHDNDTYRTKAITPITEVNPQIL